jgi:peptide/nickel transport system substrate-binding protein
MTGRCGRPGPYVESGKEEMFMKRPDNSSPSVHAALRAAIAGCTIMAAIGMTAAQAQRPQAKPSYGGTVAVRDNPVPDCLDMAKTSGGAGYTEEAMAVDTLLTSDSKFHYQPDLATKWKISHGGKWVTFTLRPNVRFSNGDPMDANAVKYTFDRVLKPGFSSGSASLLGPLKQVQVVSKNVVRFVMGTAFRPILYAVQFEEFGILDPKATAAGNACTKPVGTGSYQISAVAPGYNTITEIPNTYRNWQPSFLHNTGKPYLSKLIFRPITSDSTAVSALLSGELDVSDVPGAQLSRVKGNAKFKLYKYLQQDLNFLGFNTAHAPFDTVGARQAVAEAIDRSAVIKAAVNGLGIAAYSTLAKNIPYFDKTAKSDLPGYDPSAAKAYFSAHHITGPFNLLVWDYGGNSTAAEVIQAELAQVGVTVTITVKDFAGFAPLARAGKDDMFFFGYGDGDADIYGFEWASNQQTATGFNFSFYKSATLDNLINKGRTTLKPSGAAKVYGQIQHFMNKNVVVVPLWTDYTIYGVNKRVAGWSTWSAGLPTLQDMYLPK